MVVWSVFQDRLAFVWPWLSWKEIIFLIKGWQAVFWPAVSPSLKWCLMGGSLSESMISVAPGLRLSWGAAPCGGGPIWWAEPCVTLTFLGLWKRQKEQAGFYEWEQRWFSHWGVWHTRMKTWSFPPFISKEHHHGSKLVAEEREKRRQEDPIAHWPASLA